MGWSIVNPRAGRVHRGAAAAEARGRELVPGHRRRRVPEPLLDRARAAALGDHPVRRPHLQDGLRQDARRPHRARRRADGGRHRGARSPSRAASACSRWTRTAASSASRRSPTSAAPAPWNPGFCLGSMGIYIFDTDVLVRELRRDAEEPTQPRLRQGHHPQAGGGRRARVRVPVLGREQEGVEVLARRGHARRLLRGLDGPRAGRPRLQPLRSRVAAAHVPAAVPARQVRVRRGRPARHRARTRWCRWAASSRAARSQRSILSPGRARALVLRRRRTRS